MTQDGDHYVRPDLDNELAPRMHAPTPAVDGWIVDPFRIMARTVNAIRLQSRPRGRRASWDRRPRRANGTERHLGIPARTRDDEDRAQEARAGARLIRQRAYFESVRRAIHAMPNRRPLHKLAQDARAFTPRATDR